MEHGLNADALHGFALAMVNLSREWRYGYLAREILREEELTLADFEGIGLIESHAAEMRRIFALEIPAGMQEVKHGARIQ